MNSVVLTSCVQGLTPACTSPMSSCFSRVSNFYSKVLRKNPAGRRTFNLKVVQCSDGMRNKTEDLWKSMFSRQNVSGNETPLEQNHETALEWVRELSAISL